MIKIDEINYSNYGRCVSISNGKIGLVVTLDIGPRIIRAGFVGKQNFMFEDKERKYECPVGDKKFYNYGGHRLWISPEIFPDTYLPDNDPVDYSVSGSTVTFTPPAKSNGIAIKMDVKLDENEAKADIRHYVTNKSGKTCKLAPWAITMMSPGGYEVIPVNDNDTGYLPNRNLVLWPYTKINDPRFKLRDDYMVIDQENPVDGAFKIGLAQNKGWAVYIKGNETFMKRYTYLDYAEYPDYGCSFETYSCEDFIEIETIGAYRALEAGDTVTHDEVWCFFDNVAVDLTDK